MLARLGRRRRAAVTMTPRMAASGRRPAPESRFSRPRTSGEPSPGHVRCRGGGPADQAPEGAAIDVVEPRALNGEASDLHTSFHAAGAATCPYRSPSPRPAGSLAPYHSRAGCERKKALPGPPRPLTLVLSTSGQRSADTRPAPWWREAGEASCPPRHWNALSLALLGDAVRRRRGLHSPTRRSRCAARHLETTAHVSVLEGSPGRPGLGCQHGTWRSGSPAALAIATHPAAPRGSEGGGESRAFSRTWCCPRWAADNQSLALRRSARARSCHSWAFRQRKKEQGERLRDSIAAPICSRHSWSALLMAAGPRGANPWGVESAGSTTTLLTCLECGSPARARATEPGPAERESLHSGLRRTLWKPP